MENQKKKMTESNQDSFDQNQWRSKLSNNVVSTILEFYERKGIIVFVMHPITRKKQKKPKKSSNKVILRYRGKNRFNKKLLARLFGKRREEIIHMRTIMQLVVACKNEINLGDFSKGMRELVIRVRNSEAKINYSSISGSVESLRVDEVKEEELKQVLRRCVLRQFVFNGIYDDDLCEKEPDEFDREKQKRAASLAHHLVKIKKVIKRNDHNGLLGYVLDQSESEESVIQEFILNGFHGKSIFDGKRKGKRQSSIKYLKIGKQSRYDYDDIEDEEEILRKRLGPISCEYANQMLMRIKSMENLRFLGIGKVRTTFTDIGRFLDGNKTIEEFSIDLDNFDFENPTNLMEFKSFSNNSVKKVSLKNFEKMTKRVIKKLVYPPPDSIDIFLSGSKGKEIPLEENDNLKNRGVNFCKIFMGSFSGLECVELRRNGRKWQTFEHEKMEMIDLNLMKELFIAIKRKVRSFSIHPYGLLDEEFFKMICNHLPDLEELHIKHSLFDKPSDKLIRCVHELEPRLSDRVFLEILKLKKLKKLTFMCENELLNNTIKEIEYHKGLRFLRFHKLHDHKCKFIKKFTTVRCVEVEIEKDKRVNLIDQIWGKSKKRDENSIHVHQVNVFKSFCKNWKPFLFVRKTKLNNDINYERMEEKPDETNEHLIKCIKEWNLQPPYDNGINWSEYYTERKKMEKKHSKMMKNSENWEENFEKIQEKMKLGKNEKIIRKCVYVFKQRGDGRNILMKARVYSIVGNGKYINLSFEQYGKRNVHFEVFFNLFFGNQIKNLTTWEKEFLIESRCFAEIGLFYDIRERLFGKGSSLSLVDLYSLMYYGLGIESCFGGGVSSDDHRSDWFIREFRIQFMEFIKDDVPKEMFLNDGECYFYN